MGICGELKEQEIVIERQRTVTECRCLCYMTYDDVSHSKGRRIDHFSDHFTVVCLVAWPLNESEAGVDLVLIETSLLLLCKLLLISMRTASLT